MMMSHIQTETSEVKCHVASDKAQSRGRGRGQTETWRSDKITPTASVTIQRRRRRIKEKKNKGGEEEEEEGYGAEEDLVRWDSVAADTIVHSLMKKTEQWGRLRSVWTKSQETNYDVTVSHWTVMSLSCDVTVSLLLHINSCEGQKEATYRQFHPFKHLMSVCSSAGEDKLSAPRRSEETGDTSNSVGRRLTVFI